MAGASTTWILTGAPENFEATAAHEFSVIGLKEGRRNFAEQIEPGDRIVLYLTGEMAFAARIRVTGEMFEERTPVWPGKPGKRDPYPWRFPTAPEVVLEESRRLPAESVALELEHVRKWPPEHWKLAFQGQIRAVSPADAALLERRLGALAGAAA